MVYSSMCLTYLMVAVMIQIHLCYLLIYTATVDEGEKAKMEGKIEDLHRTTAIDAPTQEEGESSGCRNYG